MALSPEDLRSVCRLVYERSGIVLDEGKDYLIDSRLSALASETPWPTADALVAALLRGDGGADLGRRVVEAMTTAETSFFRDGHPFDVLPDLLRPARQAGRRPAVWSCACATGQEPYSIAMTLCETWPNLTADDVTILATDLSSHALDRARAGRYDGHEIRRGLSDRLRDKYFAPDGGADANAWQAKPRLRDLVRFRPLNLITDWPALPVFDVVFLRNVLIYFDAPTRQRVLERVRRQLRPGGWLVMGCAESPRGYAEGLDRTANGPTGFFRASSRAA